MSLRVSVAPLTIALIAVVAVPAFAQTTYALPSTQLVKPTELVTFENTLPRLSPGAQCRIAALRARMRTQLAGLAPATPPGSVDDSPIVNMGVLPPGGDVAELAFVVLMQATSDQDKDLKLVMSDTKTQTASRQSLRKLMAKAARGVAANPAIDLADIAAVENASAKLPPGPCLVAVTESARATTLSQSAIFRARSATIQSKLPPRLIAMLAGIGRDATSIAPNADLAAYVFGRVQAQNPGLTSQQLTYLTFVALQDGQSQLDSENDTSDMSSMRLQMAMDRRSKFVEALSNIMKKMAATDDSIVQNMK